MPLALGTRLGPFEIRRLIGAGGMGEVYQAHDTKLRRDVALKLLPEDLAGDPDRRARFEREARLLATLNHPNIAAIYGLEESQGSTAIVMELVPGQTLAETLADANGRSAPRGVDRTNASRLSIDDVLATARQIAEALATAHRKGLVHRDLKPANIKVTPEGVVKLLDFGLARVSADPTFPEPSQAPTVMATAADAIVFAGTPGYMSPEQVRGEPVDKRADIWAFGCVLYEMLTGRTAFTSDTVAATVARILEREPEWGALPPATPANIRMLLRRCLEKELARRLEDISDTLLELAADAADARPSIAILPFANLSPDKENDYFSDGLTEEIINVLARIPGLKVTARTSAFALRGKEQDVRRIAELLDVQTILEGSVRRVGSRIRVTVQLVNGRDGYDLWSDRYDRELADVFAIQDEIAQAIATALQVKLSPHQRYVPALPAYEAYLKGQYYRLQITPEAATRARECYEQAIALDPRYALPHAALASLFVALAFYGFMPTHTAIPLAQASARKALDLDPSLPEAHATLAEIAVEYDHDWLEAKRRFHLAMMSEPVAPAVRVQFGWYLMVVRNGDASQQIRQALAEDSLNLFYRHALVWSFLLAGKNGDAASEARRMLEIDDRFFLGHFDLGFASIEQGLLVEALASAERARDLAPWDLVPAGLLGGLLKRSGHTERADEQLRQIGDGRAYHTPLALFLFHLVCGDTDQAANWAQRAIEQRAPAILAFLLSDHAQALRRSPRWPVLARMLNLPEASIAG